MNKEEIDEVLERFDKTDPALQRQIVFKFVELITKMRAALEDIHSGAYYKTRDQIKMAAEEALK